LSFLLLSNIIWQNWKWWTIFFNCFKQRLRFYTIKPSSEHRKCNKSWKFNHLSSYLKLPKLGSL